MSNFYEIPSEQCLMATVSTTQYVGKAASGVAPTEPRWTIVAITTDASSVPVSVKYAGGNDTRNKIWTDRTTLTYL